MVYGISLGPLQKLDFLISAMRGMVVKGQYNIYPKNFDVPQETTIDKAMLVAQQFMQAVTRLQ